MWSHSVTTYCSIMIKHYYNTIMINKSESLIKYLKTATELLQDPNNGSLSEIKNKNASAIPANDYLLIHVITEIEDPQIRLQRLKESALSEVCLNFGQGQGLAETKNNYSNEICLGFSVAKSDRLLDIQHGINNLITCGAELRRIEQKYLKTEINLRELDYVVTAIVNLTSSDLKRLKSENQTLNNLFIDAFKSNVKSRDLMLPLENMRLLFDTLDLNKLDSLEQSYIVSNLARSILNSVRYYEYKHDKLNFLFNQASDFISDDVNWWIKLKEQINTISALTAFEPMSQEHIFMLTCMLKNEDIEQTLPELDL